MTNCSLNISIPIKFEIKTPPRGMSDYDPKALDAQQQQELNTCKLLTRKENLLYLAQHPEVKAIVSLVVRMTKIRKPRNIIEYIAKIFTRPENQIRDDISKILSETRIEFEPVPFAEYEEWDY